VRDGALVIADDETGRNVLTDDGSMESILAFKLAAAAPTLRDALGHLAARFEGRVGETGQERADRKLLMVAHAAIIDTRPTVKEMEGLTVGRDRQTKLNLSA
jgi:hypothetical protein